jgi:hypothetical protein
MRMRVALPWTHNGKEIPVGTVLDVEPELAAAVGNTLEPAPEEKKPEPAAAPAPAPEPAPVAESDDDA